jgi:peptide/nickel transport system substrate-binding protein/oligopeptide transport system substrate-binding protein
MRDKIIGLAVALALVMSITSFALVGCATEQPATEAPPKPQPTATVPAAATAVPTDTPVAKMLTTAGRELPEDAAPPEYQVLRVMGREGIYLDRSKSIWKRQFADNLVGEPLTRNDRNYEVVPGAAESWEVSEDKLVWTFHLRKDLVWSDGTPLTAHDFVYTARRRANPETGYDVGWSSYWIKNFELAYTGEIPYDQIGVEAVDDYTYQITTEVVIPYVPKLLAHGVPVPKHIVEEYGDAWATSAEHRISCGPFLLERWDKGKELVYVANPTYNGPAKPYLEKIIYKIGEDEAVFPAFEAGEIDAMFEVYEGAMSASDVARLETDPELSKQFHQHPFFMTWWIAFGPEEETAFSTKVRQAFSHAIDRDALISGPLRGKGTPAYGMLPVGFHCSDPEKLKDIQTYDPALAKELLAEAGYPDGEGFPEYTMSLRAASPGIEMVAEAIQAMIKENLGISFNIENLDRKLFMDRLNSYELPLVLIPWELDYYDGKNFMDIYLSGGRHPWSNAEYDSLVLEADSTIDNATRCELYIQAERILAGDAGAVYLWHPTVPQLWKTYVRGLPLDEPNKFGFVEWTEPSKATSFFNVYITKDALEVPKFMEEVEKYQ